MPIFICGAPRSGTTIVAQRLNMQHNIRIYDEVRLLDVLDAGAAVIGKGRDFLTERGLFAPFCEEILRSGNPAEALDRVLIKAISPKQVWGEKDPIYATEVPRLRYYYPDATIIFVLRNPLDIVGAYLRHRDSQLRSKDDFWIKDSVAQALALIEVCIEPVLLLPMDIIIVRYEQFVREPIQTLNKALHPLGVQLAAVNVEQALSPPETVGDHQFYRGGKVVPWKAMNLEPIIPRASIGGRLDPEDPAWTKVEALALRLGYK